MNNSNILNQRQERNRHYMVWSGKTLVLAQRAARIASMNKNVLILTFNITLWHYIHDHIARAKVDFSWENIEIRHFHEYCWNYFSENEIPQDKTVYDDNYYKTIVPQKVISHMELIQAF